MVGVDQAADGGADGAHLAALVTRASLVYVRDNIAISRAGGELLAPLLFTAILDANMAVVNRDPELRRLYGGVEESCPDEMRRPVSVNAVAQSLGLPFETVRRRVRALARTGEVIITPRGAYVPRSAVMTPAYNAIQMGRYERARAFHRELRDLDVLPAEAAAPPPPEPLVRAVNRTVSEYMLRACGDLIDLTGDMLGSLILLEMTVLAADGLSADALLAWARAPLDHGWPVRASTLASRLRLSPETLRRHVLGLEASGFCRRTSAGLAATAPPAARPALAHLLQANLTNVQRLFARLRELDVTAAWEAQALPAAARA